MNAGKPSTGSESTLTEPKLRLWWEATRPKTLVLAVVIVTVGTASSATWIWWRFSAALVTVVLFQVGTNLANDYYDAVRGVDDATTRVGPRRLTACGLISPRAMRRATIVVFALSFVPVLFLTAAVGVEIGIFYVVAVVAGVGYSGGPKPISGIGLGEVLDFAMAGPLGTVGAAYLQVDRLLPAAFAAAVPVGLLAASMLLVNNIRDIATDEAAGKITLAVKLGEEASKRLFAALLVASLAAVPIVALVVGSAWPLVALAAAPLAVPPVRGIRSGSGHLALVRSLEGVSRLSVVFAALLTSGLVLA